MNVGEKIVEQLMWWANGLNGIDFGCQAKELLVAAADYIDSCEMAKKHGHWVSLTDCANAGVYCSVCNKKVYKEDYALCKRKNKLRSNYCPNCGAKMDEVTTMDDRENVPNVKRLIDANELLRHNRKMSGSDFGGEFWDEAVLASDIKNAPTVDAVEVVRCKDCKHRYSYSWSCDHADDDNFYCAMGELKDGAY